MSEIAWKRDLGKPHAKTKPGLNNFPQSFKFIREVLQTVETGGAKEIFCHFCSSEQNMVLNNEPLSSAAEIDEQKCYSEWVCIMNTYQF